MTLIKLIGADLFCSRGGREAEAKAKKFTKTKLLYIYLSKTIIMSKKDRPRIKVKREAIDIVFEIVGVLALLFMIVFPLMHYAELPEQIPMHYNTAGEVDAYGAKAIVWAVPGVAIILYVLLFWVSKKPHIFNYPVKVTEENAPRLYKGAVRTMGILKCVMAWTFGYITFTTVRTALGVQDGLGKYFLLIVLALVFIPIGFLIFRAVGKK